ncbi:hypothetical protein ABZ897_23595 [Nonomuraea sp. NPDC046802]|uniref:hypothetical protein n=1 Tax=Nonomuraea sp. NPDC046802 TaxID=3154919 RepID=UPI0033E2EF5F
MRVRARATLTVASVAASMLAYSAVAPASHAATNYSATAPGAMITSQALDVIRGKTRCFRYSYNDNGTSSVTVYYHNRCKHSRGLKIRVAQAEDACVWVRGGDYDRKKFKGFHPTVQSIKEVSHCG